ncbi:alpha/beta hydrolase [Spirillospora sp. NPDC047279]|uniref:alpha/beta fold hydrolase n=1 Tax=Spirillospora sp. NPDC047279 TaxID=3155478 RepID=UPI0033CA3CAB
MTARPPVAGGWPPYAEWLAGGRRLGSAGREVFVRVDGPADGAPVTLLHGFPSSSHDWAPVLPALTARHRVLSLDFLGFGDSDKPAGHRYDLFEQADLVEEAWRAVEFPAGGALVAHDYGVTVAQELLARGVPLERVAWLNGGVYPDLHRPVPAQEALAGPGGAELAAVLTPDMLADALRPLLHRPVPDEIVNDLANAAARRDGLRNAHLLIGYMEQRRENADRWVSAFEGSGLPYGFVWGMRDPVSGGHVMQRLQERFPDASITPLQDVGHYPQVEAPEETAIALATFLTP